MEWTPPAGGKRFRLSDDQRERREGCYRIQHAGGSDVEKRQQRNEPSQGLESKPEAEVTPAAPETNARRFIAGN